jgi:hypothetical protein
MRGPQRDASRARAALARCDSVALVGVQARDLLFLDFSGAPPCQCTETRLIRPYTTRDAEGEFRSGRPTERTARPTLSLQNLCYFNGAAAENLHFDLYSAVQNPVLRFVTSKSLVGPYPG